MGNNHVFQEHDSYCGPAVVAMALKRFGIEATQQDIAKELETDHVVGTSANELQKFFEKRGFVVEKKNNTVWEDIAKALDKDATVVGYLESGGDPHYALVREVRSKEIILADPWHGDNLKLTKEEFLSRWKDNKVGQYGERMLMTVSLPEK